MNKTRILCLMGIALLWTYSVSAVSPNDSFSNSVQLSGTNITYSGYFGDATLEPGEPHPYGTNTVWLSWAAPATGAVQISATTQQFGQPPVGYPAAVFTGSAVDHLQGVQTVPIYSYQSDPVRFVAMQGVVYQFQISGPQTNYQFSLQFQPYGPCTNDYFTNAIVIQGDFVVLAPQPVAGATMEPGEPAHWGARPQKSLWWKWQPQHWSATTIDASSSLSSNYLMAVYVGNSVDTLSLVSKATNTPCNFTADGGETYYIAAAVPTNAVGDMRLFLQDPSSTASHTPDGNVLYEPSWEGTALNPIHWQIAGPLEGYVNEPGGADGMTWPALPTGTAIWQDFPTIPGHTYAIRFAWRTGGNLSSGSGDASVAVAWDGRQLGTSVIPDAESGPWHWDNNYSVMASNATSRIAFTNIGRTMEMDAFSAVDVSDPPVIVTQPASVSSVVGGSATLAVGVTGTAPLQYQWYFQDSPMNGQTAPQLDLTSLTTNQVGDYRVVITNNFGMVTSAVASLLVDVPNGATILFQPYGDTVPAGNDFNFTVVATGTPPLSYQWFFNGTNIDGATNPNLTLTNVQSDAAGVYSVRVQDLTSTVWSLPATLVVSTTDSGGGQVNFANWFVTSATNALPVFDVDGITLLNGGEYVAQLYAGPELASLRPVGQPTPFQSGYNAGYFAPQTLTLGNVAPGSNAVVQVRAWDTAFGSSFEAARAMGGRFGKSAIFQIVAGGGGAPPAYLQGLQSFSLQAGLPYLQVASITFVEKDPPHTLVWALHGQPGNIYTIEKREQGAVWQPYEVITNVTGTVNFTDTVKDASGVILYRARILD